MVVELKADGGTQGEVPPASSADLLKKIGTVKVKLEGGQTVALNVAKELRVPDGPVAILQAQKQAPACYAFWAYQAEIQMGRVRALQRKLEFVEGGYDQPIRDTLHENTPSGITESAVRAVKDTHGGIRQARMALDRARREQGVLRAMKEAHNHRCFALDRLVARMADVQKG